MTLGRRRTFNGIIAWSVVLVVAVQKAPQQEPIVVAMCLSGGPTDHGATPIGPFSDGPCNACTLTGITSLGRIHRENQRR